MTLEKPIRGQRPDPRRLAFIAALKANGGSITKAAKALGISKGAASNWHREARAGTLLRRFPGREG